MLAKAVRDRPAAVPAPLPPSAPLTKALEPPEPAVNRVGSCTLHFGQLEVTFATGDIARASADAIVSSANFELRMRSGVGEALRLRGGDEIERDAMAGGEQPLRTRLRTDPRALEAKHVFPPGSAWEEGACGRPALGTGAARVGVEMCANAMMTTLRWHAMLGGTRIRKVTVWLDSEAKRRIYQDIAEEVLGPRDVRHFGQTDVGLPDDEAMISPEGATFLDPHTPGR